MLREKTGKLWDGLATLYTMLSFKAREIKEDESAMEVIQVVMLVAVGVIAIAAVWAGVNGLLATWWEAITNASGVQQTTL